MQNGTGGRVPTKRLEIFSALPLPATFSTKPAFSCPVARNVAATRVVALVFGEVDS